MSVLAVVAMVAVPVESVVTVMMSLAPLTLATRPEPAKPASAFKAPAAAVRDSGVDPRSTDAAGAPPNA